MKTFVLLFLLISTTDKKPIVDLIGNWKLEKIECHGKIFTPGKTNYFLEISEKTIKYNTPMNTCWADSFFVDKKSIQLFETHCTEIAEQADSINKNLDYNGAYIITDSTLTIINRKGTLYLKKRN